ncbi:substrate-binding domain-containing protein [Frankia sp. AgB32]|uniref:sugar ABC transporter substrate-binding protein n=1 Tax=Frankia sp. AgB32 TaxID=631119 RepID=UPI00200C21F2|nr:substrate-binding domain-containing protein [Frankia sp. AgB32]MCK9894475.1 substrate-binding domain-containing protein [Frankia sp. AgB32]
MSPVSRRLRRSLAAVALPLAVLLTAVGCDSSSAGSSAAAAGSTSASDAAARQAISTHLGKQTFAADLTPIAQIEKAKGKKVLYTAISLRVPFFQTVLRTMLSVATDPGVTIDGCDGNLTPANISACVTRAISQHYDVIVLDNIPVDLIGQGAVALRSAGVQIISAEAEALPPANGVTYASTGGPVMMQAAANWVIADSDGKANVLLVQQNDTPLQTRYITDYVMPTFARNCPDCRVQIIGVTSAQLGGLGTQVSTALLRNKKIKYVLSEFDANVQYIVPGLQNSPRGKHIKLASALGDLAALQRVSSGQFQRAEVQVSPNYCAWAVLDQTIRVLAGATPWVRLNAPYRIFDETNIHSVDPSQVAIDDGTLSGGDTWSKVFRAAWGLPS